VTHSLYSQLTHNDQPAAYLNQATLRDVLLPAILGSENSEISYWAGKQLATQFPLASVDDLCTFFAQINFGQLTLTKHKKETYFFTLTGQIVTDRLNDFDEPDFQLEAGFIAQTVESQLRVVTEAKATIDNHKNVTIFVQTDSKAPIETEATPEPITITDAPAPPTAAANQPVDETPTPVQPEPPVEQPTPTTPQPAEPETTPTQSVSDLPSRRELHRKKH